MSFVSLLVNEAAIYCWFGHKGSVFQCCSTIVYTDFYNNLLSRLKLISTDLYADLIPTARGQDMLSEPISANVRQNVNEKYALITIFFLIYFILSQFAFVRYLDLLCYCLACCFIQ